MQRGDDMRSLDEIFRDAQPTISLGPVNETPKPSGQVLGRQFYHDSAGRTILSNKETTDQMGGGANPPGACVETLLASGSFITNATPIPIYTAPSDGRLLRLILSPSNSAETDIELYDDADFLIDAEVTGYIELDLLETPMDSGSEISIALTTVSDPSQVMSYELYGCLLS